MKKVREEIAWTKKGKSEIIWRKKIKAGIIGGAGYTGGELIRLLLLHPQVEIEFVQSNSSAGKYLHEVHSDLLGETELKFSSEQRTDVDVLFLCGGKGTAQKFIFANQLPSNLAVIDLGPDLRLNSDRNIDGRSFIYGLPELNRKQIKKAKSIANPGCFATCIELALLPLVTSQKKSFPVQVNATTGSTGAGQELSQTSHFSWRYSNMGVYKAFTHQHLGEIAETLTSAQPKWNSEIVFIPQRGNFTRGIIAAVLTKCETRVEELFKIYNEYYSSHPFVRVSKSPVDLKQVVNTNRCFIHLEKQGDNLLITSVIDNLLKGAAGQAVQNMNLIFGLPEDAGLLLKPSAF